MLRRVAIRGSGVSALCCAALLQRRGVQVLLSPTPRKALSFVVINATTAALLNEVFTGGLPFDRWHQIRARTVDWSDANEPVTLDEPAWAVPESDLLAAMPHVSEILDGPPGIIIHAGSRTPATLYRFGNRRLDGRIVEVCAANVSTSRMSAGPDGWTFTAPISATHALEQRTTANGARGRIVAPRIAWPLYGPGWFACGPSAMALDPISGDGIGYAIRSAIWLCALIVEDAGAASDYATRLALAFRSHLAVCLRLYSQARFAARWKAELESTERGLAAMDGLLAQLAPLSHRLDGFHAIRRQEPLQAGPAQRT